MPSRMDRKIDAFTNFYFKNIAAFPSLVISETSSKLSSQVSRQFAPPWSDVAGMSIGFVGGALSMVTYVALTAPVLGAVTTYRVLRDL